MKKRNFTGLILSGIAAGTVAGLFGAGGGMVLVPLLSLLTSLDDAEIFNASIAIILPICIVTICVTALTGTLPWHSAIPYLAGSAAGGLLAGLFGQKIPAVWLHKALGLFMIWGGIKYLC